MDKHTPGPWKWDYSNSEVEGDCGHVIPWSLDSDDCHVLVPQQTCWIDVNPADARLIAAAPELLAACKLACGILAYQVDDPDIQELVLPEIRAAIKAAEAE